MEKPYSPSCERNQQCILDELKNIIKPSHKRLLEIGSGTGQHAAFMAAKFPQMLWHTADLKINHDGIKSWIKDSLAENILEPLEYQAGTSAFPRVKPDIIYTANTLHIMSWAHVKILIQQLSENLTKNSLVVFYGPFKYNGEFTSESNADFDQSLKNNNPDSGIRDFENIVGLMQNLNIELLADISMPANNRLLHFIKKAA